MQATTRHCQIPSCGGVAAYGCSMIVVATREYFGGPQPINPAAQEVLAYDLTGKAREAGSTHLSSIDQPSHERGHPIGSACDPRT